MNSFQRVNNALKFKEVDRVPVIPICMAYAARLNNIDYSEYGSDPFKLAGSHIKVIKKHDVDGIFLSSHYVVEEALGAKTIHGKNSIDASTNKMDLAVKDIDDLKKLKNFDPSEHKSTMLIKKALEILTGEIKDSYFIKVYTGQGTISSASILRGMEELMFDFYDREQFVFDLFELCANAVIEFSKFLISAKPDALHIGNSVASLISRDLYRKFVLPFEKKVIQSLQKHGVPVFLHICGDTSRLMDIIAEVKPDCLELDYMVDLRLSKEVISKKVGKNKIAIQGNIAPVEMLQRGTSVEVYEEAVKLIKSLNGKRGGFILSAGCEIPPDSPDRNFDAMINASINCAK